MESYINERTKKSDKDILIFEYADIARDFDLSIDELADVLMSVDGGHNGLTVRK